LQRGGNKISGLPVDAGVTDGGALGVLQRGGNKISGLPPFQGGIKGGNSDMRVLQGIFFLGNVLTPLKPKKDMAHAPRAPYLFWV
jgi:hypothetical protein